jgi:hypothetical protein
MPPPPPPPITPALLLLLLSLSAPPPSPAALLVARGTAPVAPEAAAPADSSSLAAAAAVSSSSPAPAASGPPVRFTHDPRLREPSPVYLTEEQQAAFMQAIQCPVLAVSATQGWPFAGDTVRSGGAGRRKGRAGPLTRDQQPHGSSPSPSFLPPCSPLAGSLPLLSGAAPGAASHAR